MWKEGINLASKVQFNGFLWVFVRGINFLLFPIAWQSGATSFLTTYVGPITVSLLAPYEYCLKKCLNYNTKHSLKIEPQEMMKRYQDRDGFCNFYIMSMNQMYKTACGYILSSHKNKESSDLPVYMLCDHHILVLQGRHWMNANEESTFMGGRKFYRRSHHMDGNLYKHLIKRSLGQNILTFFIHLILFQSKMS